MIGTVIINPLKQDREKVASILSADEEIEVLAYGKDGYDALKLVANLKPCIAIMDNHLDFISGEGIPPLLKARSPSTSIVIVVTKISDYQLHRAASNDVAGIVSKENDLGYLPDILKTISKGYGFISPALAPRVLQLLSSLGSPYGRNETLVQNKSTVKADDTQFIMGEDPEEYLSKTELKILAQVGEGHTSGEIARNLSLTVGTVRNCVSSVMRKTGLNNRAQMVRYAFSCGLVRPFGP